MNYEKEYKEALERAKKLQETCDNTTVVGWCEYLFPELAESGDERIKREILNLVSISGNGNQFEEIKDWLDKKIVANDITTDEYNENVKALMPELAEQKPGCKINFTTKWKPKTGDIFRKKGTITPTYTLGIFEFGKWDFVQNMKIGISGGAIYEDMLLQNYEPVEQKPVEEVNGDDYGVDSLWHAQRILEKTLGKVEGYQTDDGLLDHKAAITAIKKLREQKPTWSEEDESCLDTIISEMRANKKEAKSCEHKTYDKLINWLKSLKNRVQPQTKEWSKEDEDNMAWFDKFFRCESIVLNGREVPQDRYLWLKSLKKRLGG